MAASISQYRSDGPAPPGPVSSDGGLDDGGPLVAFYISCNPPLRPGGVAYVLEQVKQNRIPFVEILYEPTVPWFQCTANEGRDKLLKHFMNQLILDLVDRETEGFDPDPQTGDIRISAKNPMVLSWPQFKDLGTRELGTYELFRYPSIFQPFPFKAVWDKLRDDDFEGVTKASQILQREGDSDWSLGAFRKLVGCEITYSTKEDVVYIGAKEQSSIDKALQKLDTLLKYHTLGMFTATNLIIPPNPPVSFRLDFRTVAGFGLAQATFVRTTASGAKSAYRQLYNKGLVTTYRIQDLSRSEWTTAQGPLSNKNNETIDKNKPFSVFANYSYLPRGGFEKSPDVVNGPTTEVHLSQSIGRNKATSIINWVQNVESTPSAVLPPPGIMNSDYPSAGGLVDNSTMHESAGMRGQSTLTSGHHRKRDVKPLDLLSDEIPPAMSAFTDAWKSAAVPSSRDQVGDWRSTLHAVGAAPSSKEAVKVDTGTPAASIKPSIVKPPGLTRSAINDLAGLSILPNKSGQVPENPGSAKNSGLCDQASSRKEQASLQSVPAAQNVTPGLVDLLGLEFGEGELELMPPLVPRSTPAKDASPKALLGEESPPRQYYRTMNQQAGRKGKDKKINVGPGAGTPASPVKPRAQSRLPNPSGTNGYRAPGANRSSLATGRYDAAWVTEAHPPPVRSQQPQSAVGMGLQPNAQMMTTPVISLMGARLRAPMLSPILENSLKNRATFEAALEECIARMMTRARGQSGRLSLEVVFGRIVVENVDEKAVNFSGDNAGFSCFEPIHLLREFQIFSEENIMFHPILSVYGADGDRLAETYWKIKDPTRQWELHSTKVVYDFNCYGARSGACFTLEVMADDFTHRFKSEQGRSLLDVVYVHCPNKAWDLTVHLRKTDEPYYEEKYGQFARGITDSLTVPPGVPGGKPRFMFKENSKHNVTVEQIRVRHVARYVDGEGGGSLLDITMWQDMAMSVKVPADSAAGERYVEVGPSQNDQERGAPNVWYEASISSVGVEKVFEENAAMEFGEEAKWTVDEVKKNGALKSLYLPPLHMVGQMDRIGCHMDNGRDPLGEEVQSIVQSRLEKLKKETQADFW